MKSASTRSILLSGCAAITLGLPLDSHAMDRGSSGREGHTQASARAALQIAANEPPPTSPSSSSGPSATERAPAVGEIVVTARKREETLMSAPVIASVVSGEDLAAQHVRTMDDLGEILPSIKIQRGFGGSVGTVVNVRGIGSGTSSTYIDQSVGFAVDQVGFSHGSMYDAAAFDLARVEVLRGPQGLFFGKSTTAGIISFTTADPTSRFDSAVTASYEFNADELNLNGYVSGPVTDKLAVRVAGFYNTLKGYLYNPNPAGTAAQRRIPDGHSEGARLTLLYDDPDLRFRAKLKVAVTQSSDHGEQQAIRQFAACPLGRPQNPFFQYDNCRLDKYTLGETRFPPYNPNLDWMNSSGNAAMFAAASPFRETRDGSGYLKKKGNLDSLLLEYDITPGLTLTSVSGFGHADTEVQQQGFIINLGPYQLYNHWVQQDYSQEIRLSSNWQDRWLNFMVGGLYAPGLSKQQQKLVLPGATRWSQLIAKRKTSNEALFGQLILTPIDKWEFNAGVRYTHVKERFPYLWAVSNLVGSRPSDPGADINQAPLVTSGIRYSQSNTSPEFTVTYRPDDTLTVFASYKWGYKGPGYNLNSFLNTNFRIAGAVIPFGGEKVEGAEGGVKSALLDRQLNLTFTLYRYKYIGLQVSHYDAAQGRSITSNGADAITRGAEFGVNYRPQAVSGLRIDAFVAYNDAWYKTFTTSPCYGGQTLATGCRPLAPGVTGQDLSGASLAFAPRWSGNLGVSYETAVNQDYRVTVRGVMNASSRYNFTPANSPHGWQKAWTTFDASISLARENEAWELSLIGRNLTNEHYVVTGFDSGQVTPGVLSDLQGIANRSRQVVLQLTVRPGQF
jgi:iron complex outermembrane receptor protein